MKAFKVGTYVHSVRGLHVVRSVTAKGFTTGPATFLERIKYYLVNKWSKK